MANINELLQGHVTLEVECIDRVYLNGYRPSLATGGGLIPFLTEHLGKPIASPVLLGQITQRWVEALNRWASQQGLPRIKCAVVSNVELHVKAGQTAVFLDSATHF